MHGCPHLVGCWLHYVLLLQTDVIRLVEDGGQVVLTICFHVILYPMLTFLLRLFYSHVVPCRGSLSECLRCWCWMYPTTHDGLHPAEGNSTLKNWQWALTDLTVEADPPQLVFTQIWRNQSPREYTMCTKHVQKKVKCNSIYREPVKSFLGDFVC